MAKAVPALRVERYPIITPRKAPTIAPIIGNRTIGK